MVGLNPANCHQLGGELLAFVKSPESSFLAVLQMPKSSPNEVSSREMNQIKQSIHEEKTNAHATLDRCTVWTALITPFDHNGQIDFISLTKIAREQAAAGNGILLLGSTGEGLSINEHEQWQIVKTVCDLKLTVPLMIAVGGFQLSEQLKWIEKCNELPIDAYLLGSPIYSKPGPVGQQVWFETLLEAASFPCMLYNVPSRSGVSLSVSTLSALQHHKNCWALKEASGDISVFLNYREYCPNLSIFSGEDHMVPYLANAGVKGLVSVCANTWPEATKRYVENSLNGQTESLFPIWKKAISTLFHVANPIPVKVLMQEKQQIETPTLRLPLTHNELEDASHLIVADQQISQWLVNA